MKIPRLAANLIAGAALLVIATGFFGLQAAAADRDRKVADFVVGLGQDVVQVASQHEYNAASRRSRLRALIEKALAIRSMAEAAIGPLWEHSTREQQDRFVVVFRRLLVDHYAGLLDKRAPDSFAVVAINPVNALDTRVKTRVKHGVLTLAGIDWDVREVDGANRIVDIAINGVSMVAVYRSEFRSVISRGGINGLISALAAAEPLDPGMDVAVDDPSPSASRTEPQALP